MRFKVSNYTRLNLLKDLKGMYKSTPESIENLVASIASQPAGIPLQVISGSTVGMQASLFKLYHCHECRFYFANLTL